MTELKGKALEERARELNIPGRSKMSAADLREAVKAHEIADAATKRAEPKDNIHDQHQAALQRAVYGGKDTPEEQSDEEEEDNRWFWQRAIARFNRRIRKQQLIETAKASIPALPEREPRLINGVWYTEEPTSNVLSLQEKVDMGMVQLRWKRRKNKRGNYVRR